VLHAGRVERRAPPALVVLRELDVVALTVHPDDDVSDAAPGVEPAVEAGDGRMARCGAQGGEPYGGA
jgi:hypothetical protein